MKKIYRHHKDENDNIETTNLLRARDSIPLDGIDMVFDENIEQMLDKQWSTISDAFRRKQNQIMGELKRKTIANRYIISKYKQGVRTDTELICDY